MTKSDISKRRRIAAPNTNGSKHALDMQPCVSPTPRETHPLAHAKPRGDRIIVRRPEAPLASNGGILLPDSMRKESSHRGTIIAVGPGKQREDGSYIPLDLKVGDKILFSAYSGDDLNRDDAASAMARRFVILRAEDVLATLEQ